MATSASAFSVSRNVNARQHRRCQLSASSQPSETQVQRIHQRLHVGGGPVVVHQRGIAPRMRRYRHICRRRGSSESCSNAQSGFGQGIAQAQQRRRPRNASAFAIGAPRCSGERQRIDDCALAVSATSAFQSSIGDLPLLPDRRYAASPNTSHRTSSATSLDRPRRGCGEIGAQMREQRSGSRGSPSSTRASASLTPNCAVAALMTAVSDRSWRDRPARASRRSRD